MDIVWKIGPQLEHITQRYIAISAMLQEALDVEGFYTHRTIERKECSSVFSFVHWSIGTEISKLLYILEILGLLHYRIGDKTVKLRGSYRGGVYSEEACQYI